MSKFLDCLCDENMTALIISGEASIAELEEAWLNIIAEYMEIQQDDIDEGGIWITSREIKRIEDHLFLLDICIQVLSIMYSEKIAGSVRALGYNFKPLSEIPGEYYPQLVSVVNKSKSKQVQLAQLRKELKEKLKDFDHKKPDRAIFESQLLQFEEMQKVGYDLENITVYKFVSLEKKLSRKIKQISELTGKKNGTH